LWPGYRENMRVLKWIVERARGTAQSIESPLGWVPRYEDLDWRGLDFDRGQFDQVMSVDREVWQQEMVSHDALFVRLYDKLPKEFILLRELILSSLWRAPERWALEQES
jgi:phosphoenolpyruvate carboxykinase (GTP)